MTKLFSAHSHNSCSEALLFAKLSKPMVVTCDACCRLDRQHGGQVPAADADPDAGRAPGYKLISHHSLTCELRLRGFTLQASLEGCM